MSIHQEPGFPAYSERPGAAHPRVEAPTTTLGEQKTRKIDDSTSVERKSSRFLRNKRTIGLFATLLAASGLALGVNHVISEVNHQKKIATAAPTPDSAGHAGGVEPAPTYNQDIDRFPRGERITEPRGVFNPELDYQEILARGLPDEGEYSLDRTPEEALAARVQMLEYGMNVGGAEGEELVRESFCYPSHLGLNPVELLARMAFIEQNRRTVTKKQGLLPSYYSIGMQAKPLEHIGYKEAKAATLLVELSMGDRQPYENDGTIFEKQETKLVAFKMAHKGGTWKIADVVPVERGEDGKYWPVYNKQSGFGSDLPPTYDSFPPPPDRRFDLNEKPYY